MTFSASDLGGLLLAVAVLLIAGYTVYKSFKTQQDQGLNVVKYLITQNTFILIIITFIIVVASALLSASIHPEGTKNEISWGSRALTHGALELIAWLNAIMAGPKLWDIVEWIIHRKSIISTTSTTTTSRTTTTSAVPNPSLRRAWWIKLIFQLLTLIFNLTFAIGIPIINLYMVALGLGQGNQVIWFFRDIVTDMSEFYTQIPVSYLTDTNVSAQINSGYLPADYSPFSDMYYPLQLLTIASTLLVLFGATKSVEVATLYKQAIAGKTPSFGPSNIWGAAPPPSTPSSPVIPASGTTVDDFESLFKTILITTYGFDDTTADRHATTAKNTWNGLPESQRNQIVVQLSRIKTKIDTFTESNPTYLLQDPDMLRLRTEFRAMVANSSSRGGLGISLPAPNNIKSPGTWGNVCDNASSNLFGKEFKGKTCLINPSLCCQFNDSYSKKKGHKLTNCLSCGKELKKAWVRNLNGGLVLDNPSPYCDDCVTLLKEGKCLYCHETVPHLDIYGKCDNCNSYSLIG